MKIVSACLAWIECRYDWKWKANDEIIDLVNRWLAIPVCPEQLGDLSTPRKPCEQIWNKVISNEWNDLTEKFNKWAIEALKIAILSNCNEAILKSKSPSCWVWKIYDGTFSWKLIDWDWVFTKLLKKNWIKVRTEE